MECEHCRHLEEDLQRALAWQTASPPLSAPQHTNKLQADYHTLLGLWRNVQASQEALKIQFEKSKTLRSEAEGANALKSVFLANMSHEMRTPLGIILGFSKFLLDPDQTTEDRLECAKIINRSGEQLFHLVNQILDLAKIEADKLDVELSRFNLNHLLKGVMDSLAPKSYEKDIILSLVYVGEVQKYVTTDSGRLRQILLNLLGNALKFTEHGSVKISVSMSHNPRIHLKFDIRDTGIGLSSEQAKNIWEPFTQGDCTTTRRFGGTGLGLSLSRKLAQALKGSLVMSKSTPGEGSVFTLELDAGDADKNEDAAQATKNVEHTNQLDGYKILVVEDSADNRMLFRRILTLAGAAVEEACNGQEGAHKALSDNFDVVLMDMQMPIMGGVEATKYLRQKQYKNPIIALTGNAMKGERAQSLAEGFNDHITKPVNIAHLVTTILSYPRISPV